MSTLLNGSITREKQIQDIASNTLCLALYKVKGEYTGDCLRLRRSSDDDEQDYGFDSDGIIDTTTIATWAGADTIYVVTWYDQSGWGNDATQTVNAKQPVWDNFNKIIRFAAASSQHLIVSDSISINVDTSDFSYVAQVTFASLPSPSHVFFKGTFATPRTYVRMYNLTGTFKFAVEDTSAPEESAAYTSVGTSTDYNLIGIKDGTDIKSYKNGSLENTTSLGGSYGTLTNTGDLYIGSSTGGAESFDGSMTSFLLFKKALSTSEIGIISSELPYSFSPITLAPALWLDASDPITITLNGSNVSAWLDKSGKGYDFIQGTAEDQPTYVTSEQNGRNVIRLDGVDNYMVLADDGISFAGDLTIIVALKPAVVDNNMTILGKAGVSVLLKDYLLQLDQWLVFRNTDGYADENFVQLGTSPSVVTAIWNETTNDIYSFLNGSKDTATNHSIVRSSSEQDLYIGRRSTSHTGDFLQGDVYEILIFNSVLSDAQVQQVEAYLSSKWAITI